MLLIESTRSAFPFIIDLVLERFRSSEIPIPHENLASSFPDRVQKMKKSWEEWARKLGVVRGKGG